VPLVVADIEDGNGGVLEKSLVAANTCSAGVGDLVLIATGSAARLPDMTSGTPVDASVVAIIDHISLDGGSKTTSTRRKN
jgi:ethanolamine utilization protein EutN